MAKQFGMRIPGICGLVRALGIVSLWVGLATAHAAPLPEDILREEVNGPALVLNTNRLSLKVGATFLLSAKGFPAGGSVVWSSFNPGFATVNATGLVTAVSEGTLTVLAVLAGGGSAAECKVNVVGEPAPPPRALLPRGAVTSVRIANEIGGMTVGDEIGIVAVCLPYDVFAGSDYTLESSAPGVVEVDPARIARAVGEGEATLTARSTNGCADSVTIRVKAAPQADALPPAQAYAVELEKFGIVLDDVDEPQSVRNTLGINHALLYARRHGYRRVVFPRGRYLLDPLQSISMRSNLEIDLNGSTWQIRPNASARYALVRFRELDGPNLFESFVPAGQKTMLSSLSPSPLGKFGIAEGETSLRSKPIPVGAFPAKDAPDQIVRALERGAPVFLSCPIGMMRKAVEPDPFTPSPSSGLRASQEVRFKLNYYKGTNLVASQDFGNVWIRDTAAQRWNLADYTHRLRQQEDYDAVGLELVFSLKNCCADVFVDRPVVCAKSAAVLENCRLRNGTILGERDFKEAVYPGWKNDPKTEGALAISFEEGRNNGIESMTVRKGIGFNMASRLGQQSAGAVGAGPIPLKCKNLEPGDFDGSGGKVESPSVQRTKELLDLAAIGDTFELGLPLGYMGYNLLRARVYDILFYDAGKTLLERKGGRMAYRKYAKPKSARYAHVVLHWDSPITRGHPDFGDAIGFITEYHPPVANYIRNCIIEDNYSAGLAACGGINWRIEGNVFRRNGGRMPGCDIDWEDGWEYSHDDVVRDNSFESRAGLIVCAGMNHVFRRNAIKGNMTVYGRSQYMKYADNTFGETGKTVRMSFGTQTEAYICGNAFLGGTVALSREHGDKGGYPVAWEGNAFSDVRLSRVGATNGIAARNTFVRSTIEP